MTRFLTIVLMSMAFIACAPQEPAPLTIIDPTPILVQKPAPHHAEKPLPQPVNLSEGIDRLQGQLEWVQHRIPTKEHDQ